MDTIIPKQLSLRNDPDLLKVLHQSVGIRRHIDVFLWLNSEFQNFLAHEIFIVAWGDFKNGLLLFDVISALPGVRTQNVASNHLIPFVTRLFEGWLERGGSPFVLEQVQGFGLGSNALNCRPVEALRNMRSAVVHGLRDVRGEHQCLYVSLASRPINDQERSRRAMELLMPHLDMALRRLKHVDTQLDIKWPSPASPSPLSSPVLEAPLSDLGLSLRQLEIMAWVRAGKTNNEIGQILDISMFTVKNHLQRVFKKLDVLNRAQAVALLSSSAQPRSSDRAHA